VSLDTIINAGDRDQRLSAIRKKLDERHAELLGRILDAERADDVSVNPCSHESSWDCPEVRRGAVQLLRGVRSLYAQFGLTPPALPRPAGGDRDDVKLAQGTWREC
jgi:hypothetical protein